MRRKTVSTFLIIGFSLLVIFYNNSVNNLPKDSVLAREVRVQKAQSVTENTPICALDQQMNCSVPLLSQVTSQLIGVWKLTSYETKNSKGELLTEAPWHFSDGLLMYDQLGNMAVQLVDDSHPKFPSGKFADIVKNQLS